MIASEITFRGWQGITLHGTILATTDLRASRAGVVLVHGAGAEVLREHMIVEAEAFARQGLAVLIYDKRSVGYSFFNRSYSLLADDALGAVEVLRQHPGIDPKKVGIWGGSEGGWVAPLAAARSEDVAFVIVVAANAMQPLRQQKWAMFSALQRAHVCGSLKTTAMPKLYELLADAGLFSEAFYDAQAALRSVHQPLLAIWGTCDLLTPPGENSAMFAEALQQGGNPHYTIRFFSGADHSVHRTPDRGITSLPVLASGYAELVGNWVSCVVAGRVPNNDIEPAPKQDIPTTPIGLATSPARLWINLACIIFFIVAFLCYPVAGFFFRHSMNNATASQGPMRIRSSARLVVGSGIIVVVGWFVYLSYVLLSTVKVAYPGPLFLGRPLPWIILQTLAAITLGAEIAMAVAWRQAHSSADRIQQIRIWLLLTGGVVFVAWALYWGLLLP
jgi:uncharacterized protein